MKQLPLIKASMRSADLGNLADQIARLEAGGIDALHFDIMDGRFGPEISMGPMFLRGLRNFSDLPYEAHMWVEEPSRSLDHYIEAGADYIVVHVEASNDPASGLEHLRRHGVKAGLAINPGTPVESLAHLLDLCDEINVMTIAPGRPGKLSTVGLENLRRAARLVDSNGKTVVVQADGAVSLETCEMFANAGATALVVGYPIFSRSDFGEAIAELRQCAAAGSEHLRGN